MDSDLAYLLGCATGAWIGYRAPFYRRQLRRLVYWLRGEDLMATAYPPLSMLEAQRLMNEVWGKHLETKHQYFSDHKLFEDLS
jgi:hypothetical protein